MNWDHSVIFSSTAFWTLVDYEVYSISSKGFLPTVVDIMFNWLNSPLLVHFNSLIPKMLMFTLVTSYLTTSNLPWFIDLSFQVPIQYCSLHHLTLLSPPDTSQLGVVSALAQSLHSFWSYFFTLLQVAILDTYQPGEFILQCPIFLPFHTVCGVLKARILKWFAIPFSNGPCFVRPLHKWPIHSWLALCGMAHSFTELDKAVIHVISLGSFLWFFFHSVCPLMDED